MYHILIHRTCCVSDREAMGSGGAAAETVGTAATIVAVTAASMNGATAANRERKQV